MSRHDGKLSSIVYIYKYIYLLCNPIPMESIMCYPIPDAYVAVESINQTMFVYFAGWHNATVKTKYVYICNNMR